ncbi:MAG TPA: ribulokinase [bacterium]|nr:ribulokinase [bacterium]
MSRYAIGIDFGTESARAVLVDAADGRVLSTAPCPYRHGVLDRALPGQASRLPADWALQHPGDWIEAVETLLRAMAAAGSPEDIAGIGIDFTSCTVLPSTDDGTPLCLIPEFRDEPHAWPKLWKHHAAQPYADRINARATEPGGEFLALYGGKTSSEWMWAKGWQMLAEAPPAVSRSAARWIEGGDWLIWQLVGAEVRSACQAGYKAHWQRDAGYPPRQFWEALDPALPSLLGRLAEAPRPIGTRAGGLAAVWASRTGLRAGTPVAVAAIDAHAAVPALGVHEAGELVMIMGTSTCHLLVDSRRRPVRGISGVVADGILPGLFGYEAGQASVGDIFLWFVRTAVPGRYGEAEAAAFEQLSREAAALAPGASGLLALDWWNGCRTPLVDAELSGAILGLTLTTEPADIYRALLEATACGTRRVIETFEADGVPVTALHACGGLAERNTLLLQITADVTGRPVAAARVPDASAVGAAIYAVAAAEQASDMTGVVQRMGAAERTLYRPNDAARSVYDDLYRDYLEVARHFGEGGTDLMKRLRRRRSVA